MKVLVVFIGYAFQATDPMSIIATPLENSQFLITQVYTYCTAQKFHYPQEMKMYTLIYTEETRIQRDTCTPMFIAALFIIART